MEVRNFQSLRAVDLDLGRYTVIVGPSSSGKSALIRALRAVASNVRGASTITRGQKSSAITVRTGEHVVTLERTETAGTYRVVDTAGQETIFTKLNGGVPDAVTAALGIDPVPATGTSVNFAGQFDKPYLLGESGSVVAKVLGELTNVSTIFEAVALANKHRKNAASTLKTRDADAVDLGARLAAFEGLSARLDTLHTVEQRFTEATALFDRANRLAAAITALTAAEHALTRSQKLPQIPDPQPAYDALQRLRHLVGLLERVSTSAVSAQAHERLHSQHAHAEQQATRALTAALHAAGQCPTCGQRVSTASGGSVEESHTQTH